MFLGGKQLNPQAVLTLSMAEFACQLEVKVEGTLSLVPQSGQEVGQCHPSVCGLVTRLCCSQCQDRLGWMLGWMGTPPEAVQCHLGQGAVLALSLRCTRVPGRLIVADTAVATVEERWLLAKPPGLAPWKCGQRGAWRKCVGRRDFTNFWTRPNINSHLKAKRQLSHFIGSCRKRALCAAESSSAIGLEGQQERNDCFSVR